VRFLCDYRMNTITFSKIPRIALIAVYESSAWVFRRYLYPPTPARLNPPPHNPSNRQRPPPELFRDHLVSGPSCRFKDCIRNVVASHVQKVGPTLIWNIRQSAPHAQFSLSSRQSHYGNFSPSSRINRLHAFWDFLGSGSLINSIKYEAPTCLKNGGL